MTACRRTTCAVCRRPVAVATSGRFYPHAPTAARGNGGSRCLGSSKTPEAAKSVLAEQNNRARAARAKEATDV